MRKANFTAWAGAAVCAVLIWAASVAMAAPCSRFEIRGLAPGMTAKQVWNLMGGKGQQSEVGRRSISQYVIDGTVIEIEYDGWITRKNQPRLSRVETRVVEQTLSYGELVQSLVERVGQQPVGGLPGIAGGPALWVDEACQIQVTASRHLPEWWEPGQGPTVHVEVRVLTRAMADRFAQSDRRPADPGTLDSRSLPAGDPKTETSGDGVDTPLVAIDTRTEDDGNADAVAPERTDSDGADLAAARPIEAADARGLGQETPAVAAFPEPVPPSAAVVPAASDDSSDVRAPVVLYNPPPRYPDAARMSNLGGSVVLEVLVNEQGRVDDVTVSSSEAKKILQGVAKRAVRRWRYEPAIRDGVPVSMWTTVTIDFERPNP